MYAIYRQFNSGKISEQPFMDTLANTEEKAWEIFDFLELWRGYSENATFVAKTCDERGVRIVTDKEKEKIRIKELKQLATQCTILKNKLGEAGLFKTMHVMEKTVKVVDCEIAEQIQNPKTNLLKEE